MGKILLELLIILLSMLIIIKDNLILGEGPTQGLDDTMITEEFKYFINFQSSGKKICI